VSEVGVVNGVLVDPRSWFFWKVGTFEGNPAADWQVRLKGLHDSGMRKNPQPGERPVYDTFYGVTIMIDAGGNPRGRIWLPTQEPEANGYFTREVQVIADGPTPGSLIWHWSELGGNAYSPLQPPGTIPVDPPVVVDPPTPPPTGEGFLEALDLLRQIAANQREVVSEIRNVKDQVAEFRKNPPIVRVRF
jgi:hypothetical protein